MPKIKVNTSQLATYESDMQGILSRVNSIANQFDSVSRSLDWDIKVEENINTRLLGLKNELSAEARGISGMKEFLGTAIKKYDAVESKNSGKKLKNENFGSGVSNNISSKSKKTTDTSNSEKKKSFWNEEFGKWLKTTFGKTMTFGTAISAKDAIATFKKMFSDIDIPEGIKTMVNLYKNVSGMVLNTMKIGNAISATAKTIKSQEQFLKMFGITQHEIGRAQQVIKNAKSDLIKKLSGVDDSLSSAAQSANVFLKNGIVKQSWRARFADQFSESIKSSTKGLKKTTGIITSGLTIVLNGVENFNDYKSGRMSGIRAVAETVTESGIDIGTGLIVGAAVTAGLAATVGSAPVLAVAGISTAVIMGGDAICKRVTKKVSGEEKRLTEAISDFVLDTGKKKFDKTVKKINTVFNIGSKTVLTVYGG